MPLRELNSENIWKFKDLNKLTAKDIKLMVEAFRRKHLINQQGVGVTNGWVGLGTPYYYKSKYFQPAYEPVIPRTTTWFKLTIEGQLLMEKMEEYFAIPKDPVQISKLNEKLYDF